MCVCLVQVETSNFTDSYSIIPKVCVSHPLPTQPCQDIYSQLSIRSSDSCPLPLPLRLALPHTSPLPFLIFPPLTLLPSPCPASQVARAKISIRTVPHQNPERLIELIRAHCKHEFGKRRSPNELFIDVKKVRQEMRIVGVAVWLVE